ncbi:MAG: histidine kinase [Bacillota bacterium]
MILKKRLAVALPVSILVFSLALWFLSNNYSEIDQLTRMLIALGGTVLSGIITYFLFPENERKI